MHSANKGTIPCHCTEETSTKAVKSCNCQNQVIQQQTGQTNQEHCQQTTIKHHNTQQLTTRIDGAGSENTSAANTASSTTAAAANVAQD